MFSRKNYVLGLKGLNGWNIENCNLLVLFDICYRLFRKVEDIEVEESNGLKLMEGE